MTRYAVVRILDEETPLWSEFSEMFLRHARTVKAPNSVRCNDSGAIKSFSSVVGNPRISEINIQHIDRWQEKMKETMQPQSMRTKLAAMSAIFAYAVKQGILGRNPFVDVKMPRPHFAGRLLTDDELKIFLGALGDPEIERICRFALYTGMRKSEIFGLEWDWVANESIMIPAIKSKNKKGRIVGLHPSAVDLMGPRRDGRVFKVYTSQLSRALKRARQTSGLGRVRLHDMRHNWATRFFELCKDPWAVMDAGGWSNEASMRPYQHMTKDRQNKIFGLNYSF